MNSHLEFPMQNKGTWLNDAAAYLDRGSIRLALVVAMKTPVDNWIDRLILIGTGMSISILSWMGVATLVT